MEYEYKSLDFYNKAEAEATQQKIKLDILEMLKIGWVIEYTINFPHFTTVFFKKQK